MRLDHYIASQSAYSRRQILELLKQGQIRVNRDAVSSMALELKPSDRVYVGNQEILNKYGLLYYMYHKPKGVISTLEDPSDRYSLAQELRRLKLPPVLFPVGRLDRDSSGLLLLTNDGDFSHQILHPSFKLPKTYVVGLNRVLEFKDVSRLRKGLILEDGPVVCESVYASKKTAWVTLSEGRNRIVRRMFAALGYKVVALHRVKVGNWDLGKLPVGGCKAISV